MEAYLLHCWGKTGQATDEFHPALFHMLDVGHVAREMLGQRASPRWRHVLGRLLGADPDALCDWLPWFTALHDIGKLSAAFQGSNSEQRARLTAEGFSFGAWRHSLEIRHGEAGAVFVADVLPSAGARSMPEALWLVCVEMVAGHHGTFLRSDSYLRDARVKLRCYEPAEWGQLRTAAAALLEGQLATRLPDATPAVANVSAAVMALCGFTSLCDWIGSDNTHFPPRRACSLREYAHISAMQAREAVATAGFHQPSCSVAPTTFADLFRDLGSPRPLQEAIDRIPASLLSQPCLAIIEAPTGEGKTEAALALAHRLARATGSDELYYALPTTATSNQMFGRLQKHIAERLGLSARVKLVHGQAFLFEDDAPMEPRTDGDPEGQQVALEWFRPKKRALLVPFGVGTIDQAELAALVVRYGALRMAGLAGKVLILDEVHAYDTYMTTIVERLLRWLAALGTSVLVLSATLPRSRRVALMRTYGAEVDGGDTRWLSYPSLWVGNSAESYHATPPAWQPQRRVGLDYLHLADDEPEAKARWLLEAAAGGGCACWIANTVGRAQAIFERLQALAPPGVDLTLLHAQFPLEDRQALEEEVSRRYGPEGERPRQGIVVGTQVLEQSLDLDFDVMVSDLAPIDLLLQRAGRLHRHARSRTTAHREPRLWVNATVEAGGDLKLGADRYVYAEFILRQTWQALAGRHRLSLPADYRALVEAVYDAGEPTMASPLRAAWQKLRDEQVSAVQEAWLRLWADPDPEAPCTRTARPTFEEDENSAAWIVARTRLGEESVVVVPLERDGEWARVCGSGERINLGVPASREAECRLMRRSLRISHRAAVCALRAAREPLPPLFSRSALLKGCLPLWLGDGRAQLPLAKGTLIVTLDSRLGLVIRREGG